MIELGIFEKTFVRPSFGEALDAVVAAGFGSMQLHLEAAGMEPMPRVIEAGDLDRIRREIDARGLKVAGLSATYNMAHPDLGVREDGLARLATLAKSARDLGASTLTLCTGTRHPDDKWRFHPDNATPEAWRDMSASIRAALDLAERHGVTLAVEPEPANVVRDAVAARRLLDEVGSDRLGIILDPANIVAGALDQPPGDTLSAAFDVLGPDIVMAHGKDVTADGRFCPVGRGVVPWPRLLDLLRVHGYSGPIVLHSLTESDVPACMALLSHLLDETD